MTHNTPINSRRKRTTASPRDAYVATFQTRLTSLLRFSGQPDDVDDMVGREVAAVWCTVDAKMAAYPDPAGYAAIRATAGRAAIGFHRTEKSQRGEGARGGRTVVSYMGHGSADRYFDFDVPGPTVFRASRTGFDPVTEFVDQMDDITLMQSAMIGLPERQRTVLYLVDGQGYTVTEAAHTMGVTRETASRYRAAAFRALDIEPPC